MKVTVPEDVLVQTLEGESVLLNLETEQYFGLDDIGTTMWNILRETGSIDATYERILPLYDVEAETLRQDLEGLVEQLADHGLVKVVAR